MVIFNINSILAFLNSIHRNIKFTVDHETNHCLHFFDTDIKFTVEHESLLWNMKLFTSVL